MLLHEYFSLSPKAKGKASFLCPDTQPPSYNNIKQIFALLRSQFGLLHESLEVVLALLDLGGLLLAFLVRSRLDEVLKLVLTLPGRQQQVPLVKDNLVKLLLPGGES